VIAYLLSEGSIGAEMDRPMQQALKADVEQALSAGKGRLRVTLQKGIFTARKD
jgi:hypothetical protein